MLVANIQRFCMHDGPGIRTTVFLKGCPLHCAWCHNPETQSTHRQLLYYEKKCMGCGACEACPNQVHSFAPGHQLSRSSCTACGECAQACPTGALELCGKEYTAEQLMEAVRKDSAFYGTDGGVTLSGGEPLLQAEEVVCFLRLCKEDQLHTAVETCGMFASHVLETVTPLVDLFLWDIKDMDAQRHKAYTGASNEKILENLLRVDALGGRTRIRCILINGVNTEQNHYDGVLEILRKLRHCEGIEFMPYHTYGGSKAQAVGKEVDGNESWIPDKVQVEEVKTFFAANGINVF